MEEVKCTKCGSTGYSASRHASCECGGVCRKREVLADAGVALLDKQENRVHSDYQPYIADILSHLYKKL